MFTHQNRSMGNHGYHIIMCKMDRQGSKRHGQDKSKWMSKLKNKSMNKLIMNGLN